jgi:hypothetical protein
VNGKVGKDGLPEPGRQDAHAGAPAVGKRTLVEQIADQPHAAGPPVPMSAGAAQQRGVAALGGMAGDAGAPISDAMITGGTVPVPKGRFPVPKAVQIAP